MSIEDELTPIVLTPSDASFAAECLLRLADLVEPNSDSAPAAVLGRFSDEQVMMLRKPAYRRNQRGDIAVRLRTLANQTESQLPGSAPAIRH